MFDLSKVLVQHGWKCVGDETYVFGGRRPDEASHMMLVDAIMSDTLNAIYLAGVVKGASEVVKLEYPDIFSILDDQ